MNITKTILRLKKIDLTTIFSSLLLNKLNMLFEFPENLFEQFVRHSNEKVKVESAILNLLNKIQPTTILNIGAGLDTLTSSELFPLSVKNITLLEKSSNYAHTYNKKNVTVINNDFEKWSSNQKYDVILASHVLYYFQDKSNAIDKMLSLLSKDGVILFVTHKPKGDYKRIKDLVFKRNYAYSYDNLINILHKSNSHIKEIEIECTVRANNSDELCEAVKLWFEMDLKTYVQCKPEILKFSTNNELTYFNSLLIVRK